MKKQILQNAAHYLGGQQWVLGMLSPVGIRLLFFFFFVGETWKFK